ncbi:uncharacterized protein RSE6_08399 [Rhynchosporium secalis]|uniref:Fibroin-3 n=1 Tax=Rhynchosporium secalis TaxID=38038 RepID=A0A1E1MFG2_RHYSE|nr:uncharacterized protein RSE6_08399 [Rhynchosporium secalis]
MPHITTSMQMSVRRSIGELLFDSLLGKRVDIAGKVSGVKDSFSSWDKCMQASYCKWPVIAAIVVVSLTVISVLTCIGRKSKPMKNEDGQFQGSQSQGYQGYQRQPPMMGGALHAAGQPMNVAAPQAAAPQYAQFEVGRNGLYVEPKVVPLHEDALPPMPSWDTAQKKHIVQDEEKNGVELGELDPTTGQKIPLMAGAAGAGTSHPPSPDVGRGASPFGARPGAGNGYMGVAGDNQNQNNGISRHGSPAPGQDRGGYGARSPGGYDGPGRGQNGYDSPGTGGAYGGRQPQGQYSADGRPFPPQNRQYSSDVSRPMGPGRQYTDPSYASDNMAPRGPSRGPGPYGPPRGPSRGPGPNDPYGPPRGGPGGPLRTGSPALNNNAGFDFGRGGGNLSPSYQSRPSPPQQQQGYGRPPPQSSNSGYFDGASIAPSYSTTPKEQSYLGYKTYQPGNGDRGGYSQDGREREPQRWDPVHQ